ncbi:ribonuclease J [Enterovirga rhinocerotis]|nr:ribonuclease J [Enterovirga rhinocerotis]
MNAALYGFGPERSRKWILVDCGMGFAGEEHTPGIDLMYPDLSFIIERRKDLLGILITHAHEDHIGALVEMWPKLRAPVFATRFAASLIATRKLSEPGAPKIEMTEVAPGKRFSLGPFDIEYVPVSHSIPESNAVALRTPHGLVVHTGDWKLDPAPTLGSNTSEATFRALGEEGILALVCDSTNIVRDGESPSESEVATTLARIIKDSPHRVAVTTFASNVARIRAVAEAALAAGREVVVVGRAMDRVITVARELGYLDGLPDFKTAQSYSYIARDKVVALLTGSQGEPRAALARVAEEQHPDIALTAGDRVIFSSRTIPGNESEVNAIINALVRKGIDIVTDRHDLVHVSGHPRKGEMRQMYEWTKPRIAVPAHGEDLHLAEHAAFARAQGVADVVKARNGTLVRLAPGRPEIRDHVRAGRLYRDGDIVIPALDKAIPERRKLAFAGIVSVAIAMNKKGEFVGEPAVDQLGLPELTRSGDKLIDVVDDAILDCIKGLSRAVRRDPDAVEDAVARAIRGALRNVWGKKPACHVMVVEV